MLQPVTEDKKNRGGKDNGPVPNGDGTLESHTARTHGVRARILSIHENIGFQGLAGLALIAASVVAVTAAGASTAQEPVWGALRWLLKGGIQATYAALLALSVWLVFGRGRGISYLLCFGLVISIVVVWSIVAGLDNRRQRQEANKAIASFRDGAEDAPPLSEIMEGNPYVEAYMVMREVHWDLQDRLKRRIEKYRAEYEDYVAKGPFLAVDRLRSRYELWRSYYQIQELEGLLDSFEKTPLETTDLEWTVDLLAVDPDTREVYKRDLERSISTLQDWQSEFVAGEKRTLGQFRHSLKVVIDAQGRYRFAKGQIVFEDPADAASFGSKELGLD